MGEALFNNKGFHQCSNEYRSSYSNESMHQRFQDPCKSQVEIHLLKGVTGLGLMKSDDKSETLNVEQELKIRAEIQVT